MNAMMTRDWAMQSCDSPRMRTQPQSSVASVILNLVQGQPLSDASVVIFIKLPIFIMSAKLLLLSCLVA